MARTFIAFAAMSVLMMGSQVNAKGPGNNQNRNITQKKSINIANLQTANTMRLQTNVTKNLTKQVTLPRIQQGNGNRPLLAQNFRSGKVPTAFHCKTPARVQGFCMHHNFCGWTSRCWLTRHQCCGYWSPTSNCWYYWYPPFCCYLPMSCINMYPPGGAVPTLPPGAPQGGIPAPGMPSGGTMPPTPDLPPDSTPLPEGTDTVPTEELPAPE